MKTLFNLASIYNDYEKPLFAQTISGSKGIQGAIQAANSQRKKRKIKRQKA